MYSNKEHTNHIDQYSTPEHKLWAAVLLQAIHDVHIKESEKYPRYWRNDAIGWFKAKLIHVGSFIWICELFDMDAEQVRSLVLDKEP